MATWNVIHGDCLEVLKTLEAGSIDAVVTDPPYGISYNHEESPQEKWPIENRGNLKPVYGDAKPFDPTPWLKWKQLILFGGQCYAHKLPEQPAWLAWAKVNESETKIRIAEFELIYARPLRRSQMFRYLWFGYMRDGERGEYYHPTQKPVSVMRWCMDRIGVPVGATVLDPYCGSGSTGVACVQTGRNFIGIEIDASYCEIARRRIAEAANHLFAEVESAASA